MAVSREANAEVFATAQARKGGVELSAGYGEASQSSPHHVNYSGNVAYAWLGPSAPRCRPC
jgi:hypothetical protein